MRVSKGAFKSSVKVAGDSRSPTPNKSERSYIVSSSPDYFKTGKMIKGKNPSEMGNLLTTKKYNMSTQQKASKINLLDIPTNKQTQQQAFNRDFRPKKPLNSQKSTRSISNDKGSNQKVKSNVIVKNEKTDWKITQEQGTKIHQLVIQESPSKELYSLTNNQQEELHKDD